jgi:hypothetical protein
MILGAGHGGQASSTGEASTGSLETDAGTPSGSSGRREKRITRGELTRMMSEQEVKEEPVEYVIGDDEVFCLEDEDDVGKLDDENANLSESMLESDDETSTSKGAGSKRDDFGRENFRLRTVL